MFPVWIRMRSEQPGDVQSSPGNNGDAGGTTMITWTELYQIQAWRRSSTVTEITAFTWYFGLKTHLCFRPEVSFLHFFGYYRFMILKYLTKGQTNTEISEGGGSIIMGGLLDRILKKLFQLQSLGRSQHGWGFLLGLSASFLTEYNLIP